MRRQSLSPLSLQPIARALLFLVLILPFAGCAKRARNSDSLPRANDQQSGTLPQAVATANQINAQRININTAAAKELETLPGIGKGLAERIIEHREKYGPFRRPEHLIIVRGISDGRFRALRALIVAE